MTRATRPTSRSKHTLHRLAHLGDFLLVTVFDHSYYHLAAHAPANRNKPFRFRISGQLVHCSSTHITLRHWEDLDGSDDIPPTHEESVIIRSAILDCRLLSPGPHSATYPRPKVSLPA